MANPNKSGIAIVYDEKLRELRFFKFNSLLEIDKKCNSSPAVIFDSIDHYAEWCSKPKPGRPSVIWSKGAFDVSLYGPDEQSEIRRIIRMIVSDEFECVDKVYNFNADSVERSLKTILYDLLYISKFNSIEEYKKNTKKPTPPTGIYTREKI